MSRYAPTTIATEAMKVKGFIKVLNKRYSNLATLATSLFDTVVDKARQVEMRYKDEDSGKPKKNKATRQPSAHNIGYCGAFHMDYSEGLNNSDKE